MQVGLTAVASRISVKKMVVNLKEATESYAAMRAANGSKDPPYAAVLADSEALAMKYAATQGNKETMALLSRGTVMDVVPQQPGPKKQPPKPKPKPQHTGSNQQSRGQCGFYKSGNCNRGAQCPFDHGTEADSRGSGGARGMEDPTTAQTVCGAAVVREMAPSAEKPPYRAPPYQRVRFSDVGNQCLEGYTGEGNRYALLVEGGEAQKQQKQTETPHHRAAIEPQHAGGDGDDVQVQKYAAWLVKAMQGVSRKTGYRVIVVLAVTCLLVQLAQTCCLDHHQRTNDKVTAAYTVGVIADTGATIKGVGRDHTSSATNQRNMSRGVAVETANDTVVYTDCADLPMNGEMQGTMDEAIVMENSAHSVQPVVPTCEQYNLGFQIAQGGNAARYYRDGETIQLLDKEGQLFTVPVQDEQWHECGEWPAEQAEEGCWQCKEGSADDTWEQGVVHPEWMQDGQRAVHSAVVVKAGRPELAGRYRQLQELTVQQLQPPIDILVTTTATEAALPVLSKKQMRQTTQE